MTLETVSSLDVANERASRLTPELQAFVRTSEFKEWFGDWENNPDNASKMIDENGEPALVFFGGASGITQLSGDQRNRTGSDEIGFYFTTRKGNARFYAETLQDPQTDEPIPSSVYGAFLNIRDPYMKQPGDGVRTERIDWYLSGTPPCPVARIHIANATPITRYHCFHARVPYLLT